LDLSSHRPVENQDPFVEQGFEQRNRVGHVVWPG
jgi:hypothetical protein